MGSDSLRQFLVSTRSLNSLPRDLVRKVLRSVERRKYRIIQPQDEEGFDLSWEEDKTRYLVARNGHHLMIPFQCELCHFRNLKGTDPRRKLKTYCY